MIRERGERENVQEDVSKSESCACGVCGMRMRRVRHAQESEYRPRNHSRWLSLGRRERERARARERGLTSKSESLAVFRKEGLEPPELSASSAEV